MTHKKKVMIGMSGGVDSSVAAAVLIEKGYEVYGVTMQIWSELSEDRLRTEGGCCSLSAVDDARRVADLLGIPYYVMNFKEVFQQKVVDYFTEEYIKGKTPNPCIACNRFVKFEALLQKAIAMGMDYIATGHYARIEFDSAANRYLLKKSATESKDQTYALYTLTQEQLSKTLMPVGDYTKDQIREMARALKLSVAAKPDSQEICFVEDNNYSKFICETTGYKGKPGNFTDTKGNIIGRHSGIINFTVGQRKGLGITFGKPMYVVAIDEPSNTVVLGDGEEVFAAELIAGELNFIAFDTLGASKHCKAKIRYSAKEAEAEVFPIGNDKVKVVFTTPQRAITPGQSVVFYDNDIVLGGGIIL